MGVTPHPYIRALTAPGYIVVEETAVQSEPRQRGPPS
jgi:hypothetical protein